MKLNKPIVFFDLETTGLNQSTDRIVEMYMLKENPDGTTEEFHSRFNPHPVSVSEDAQKVHGISTEDLLGEPSFSEKVNEIIEFMKDSDLSGYNIIFFDLPLLFEEIARTGKLYDFRKHRIIDTFSTWSYFEPRTLTGAVRRFLGEGLEHAHEAKADVEASRRIFHKQMDLYRGMYSDLDEIVDSTAKFKDKIDFAGKFIRGEEGKILFSFGKHKNKTVQQVFIEDADYFKWMFEKAEMPTDTRLIARKIYSKLIEEKNEIRL
jgi:DNA polymerase-3 subunit epsilon